MRIRMGDLPEDLVVRPNNVRLHRDTKFVLVKGRPGSFAGALAHSIPRYQPGGGFICCSRFQPRPDRQAR